MGAEALWRGTAGACEGQAPTLERSTDNGDDVVLARLTPESTRLALTSVAPGGSTTDAGCAAVTDPAAPATLAVAEDYVMLWSGNDWVNIPR